MTSLPSKPPYTSDALQSANDVDEPPVVARVVVEIRSDGSRTIARGAMEDLTSGQRVAIEARGTSLLNVALQLAGSMRQLPSMIRGGGPRDGSIDETTAATRPRKRDVLRQQASKLISKLR